MIKNFDPKKVYISKEYLEELKNKPHPLNKDGVEYYHDGVGAFMLNEHDRWISRSKYDQLVEHWDNVGGIPSKIRKHVQKHNHYIGMARNMVVLSAMSEFQRAKHHAYDMVNNLQGRLVKVFGYDHGLLIGLGKTKDTLRVMVKHPSFEITHRGMDTFVGHKHFKFPEQVPKGGVWNWWMSQVFVSGITREVEVPALDVDLPDSRYNTNQ